MLSLFTALCLSADFCYRPNDSFKECPQGAQAINSIDDLRAALDEDDQSITLYLYNSKEYPFSADNAFRTKLPITVSGAENSYMILSITSSTQAEQKITISDTTINVISSSYTPRFKNLDLSNVVFETAGNLRIEATSITADIQSIQYFYEIELEKAYLSFSKFSEKKSYPTNTEVVGTQPEINFYDMKKDSLINFNNEQVTVSLQSHATPLLAIVLDDSVTSALQFYVTVDGCNLIVQSGYLVNKYRLQPMVQNKGSVKFEANTQFLSEGKNLIVESGTIQFVDQSSSYNLYLLEGYESKLIFDDSFSIGSIQMTQHELDIDNEKNSYLTVGTMSIAGSCQFTADNNLIINGKQLVFHTNGAVRTSHVTFSEFETIDLSLGTNKIGSLNLDNARISVPISYTKYAYLQLDNIIQSNKLSLVLTDAYDGSATSYEQLINKELVILKASQATDQLDCDNVEVYVEESSDSDPWADSKLFTKEKFLFEKICTPNKVSIKLLEDPRNVYKKLIYTNEYKNYGEDVNVFNDSYSWSNYMSKYTQGVEIYVHSENPREKPFDIAKYPLFNNSIHLKFSRSPYQTFDSSPIFYMNSLTITPNTIDILTLNRITLLLLHSEATNHSEINVRELYVLDDSSLSQPFRVYAEKVAVKDSVLKYFNIEEGMDLTIMATDPIFHLVFNDDGWYVQSESVNTVKIPGTVHLTVSSKYGTKVYLDVGESTKSPLTTALDVQSNKFTLFVDSKFNTLTNMPPIALTTTDTATVVVSSSSQYVPIQFLTMNNVQFLNSNPTGMPNQLKFPDQKSAEIGKYTFLSVNEANMYNNVQFSSLLIPDSTKNGGMTRFNSDPKVTFQELRTNVRYYAYFSNVTTDQLFIDGTADTYIKDCNIKHLLLQGELSIRNFPVLTIENMPVPIQDIFIEIGQPSAESITSFTRTVIKTTDPHVDLYQLKDKVTLSSDRFYFGSQTLYLSVGVSTNSLYLMLSSSEPGQPTEEPSSSTTDNSQDSSTTGKSSKLNSTEIIIIVAASVVVVAVAVLIVIIIKKRSVRMLDNDSLTISNEYMIQDSLRV